MSKPWYPFYHADYERKTRHLSMVEHGAYRLLLDDYYSNARPLPANAKSLLRICKASGKAEASAVLSVVGQFFELRGDAYHHDRADEEIAEQARISQERAKNGAKGAAKKHGKQLPAQSHLHDSKKTTSSLASPETPLDLKRELWARGKVLLERFGIEQKPAGELLGKWRRDHGDLAVLSALANAEAGCVSEPVAYIEKVLKGNFNGPGFTGRNRKPTTGDALDKIFARRAQEHEVQPE